MINPLEAFGKVGATTIVLCIWTAAIICLIGAISQARTAADISSQASALESLIPQGVVIKEEKLNTNDYQDIAHAIATRYSTINVTAGKDKVLELTATSVDSYSAWLAALFDVMASRPDVRWAVSYLCAGEKCNGPAFRIELEGIRRVATTS